MLLFKMIHTKCRSVLYPLSEIQRFALKDEEVSWIYKLDSYSPPEYNAKVILNQSWADPPSEVPTFKPKWNEVDAKVNRISFNGPYEVVDNRPLNPMGRTGLKGRGRLGRWGPNHAADPIVTRWKRDHNIKIINENTKLYVYFLMFVVLLLFYFHERPVLEFCAIQRRDNGQWALPGGMVDPGEQISETLKREFLEEALNSLEVTEGT